MKTTFGAFGGFFAPLVRHFILAVLAAASITAAHAAITVTITAPTNGAVFTAGSNITVSATASATGGYTISKVEFFHGGTNLIGTDTSSPYSISWNNVPAGSYTLTAKATAIKKNNPDQTQTSAPVSITVNVLPSVSMTSPSGGAVFAAPGSMTLTATASDSDGTISKVEFFHGGTNLIATVTSSPYTYNWSGVSAGGYSLIAKATDNNNGTTTSSPVSVTVSNAPSVSLTSPSGGAVYSAPASVTLTATASDTDGIQKVEFFHGGTNLIATVTSPPFTHNWTNVAAASYSITAKATDNLGIPTTSAPVGITVSGAAPAGLYFIHPDHLNTPRAIYSDQQQLAWKWDQQEPFGNSPPNENPSGLGTFECNVRFPGQYFDKETNLAYNYFRDFDSSLGRYVQSDPIGLEGGLNTYAYVRSSPLMYDDPTGEVAWVFAGAAAGAAVNTLITVVSNASQGKETTWEQAAAAAASGAISGAYSALGGPFAGTIARAVGARATRWNLIFGNAAFSAAGGYVGQVVANCIDPQNASNPWNAAAWAGVGGGVAAWWVPTPGLTTVKQSGLFGPTTFGGANRNAIVPSVAASTALGGGAILGLPISGPPTNGCGCP